MPTAALKFYSLVSLVSHLGHLCAAEREQIWVIRMRARNIIIPMRGVLRERARRHARFSTRWLDDVRLVSWSFFFQESLPQKTQKIPGAQGIFLFGHFLISSIAGWKISSFCWRLAIKTFFEWRWFVCFFRIPKKPSQNLVWHQSVNIVLQNCTMLFYIIHTNLLARSFSPRVSDDNDLEVLMNVSWSFSFFYIFRQMWTNSADILDKQSTGSPMLCKVAGTQIRCISSRFGGMAHAFLKWAIPGCPKNVLLDFIQKNITWQMWPFFFWQPFQLAFSGRESGSWWSVGSAQQCLHFQPGKKV